MILKSIHWNLVYFSIYPRTLNTKVHVYQNPGWNSMGISWSAIEPTLPLSIENVVWALGGNVPCTPSWVCNVHLRLPSTPSWWQWMHWDLYSYSVCYAIRLQVQVVFTDMTIDCEYGIENHLSILWTCSRFCFILFEMSLF